MAKLSLLVGFAAGYVLGARAGKERYAQIKRVSNRVWTSGPVERQKAQARLAARTKAAPFVADLVGDAARATASRLRESGTREPRHLHSVQGEVVRTGTDD